MERGGSRGEAVEGWEERPTATTVDKKLRPSRPREEMTRNMSSPSKENGNLDGCSPFCACGYNSKGNRIEYKVW